jgi:tetratricopeptide (TPR) repeat protein
MPPRRFILALRLAVLASAAPATAPVLALPGGSGQVSTAPQKDAVTRSDEAFAKGVALHQAGDIIGAIDSYEQALKLTPWRLDARSNLGAALVRLGRFEEAIEHYRKALETDAGQVGIRFNLGLALYKTGAIQAAAAEFQQVVERDPSQRKALLLLADCELQMGHDARVVELLSPLERELGDDRLYAFLLGHALLRQNELQRGQAMIDRLFQGGETAEGHLLLGVQHMRRVDSRQAVPELQRAAELNPDLPTVHSLLGVALMNAGERPAAMAAFRRELKSNPNDFQANLRLALLLRDENRLDEASDYLARAARLRPKDPDVMYGVARIQLGRDDLAGAQKTLEELTASAPGFEGGHVLLATVYYRTGRKEDGDRERATVERLKAERKQRELAEQGETENPGDSRP